MIDWEKRKEEIRELFLNGFLPGRKYSPIIEKQLDKIIEQEKEMIHAILIITQYNKGNYKEGDMRELIKASEEHEKYKIITLCGSTKFKDEYIDIQKKLTLEGNIVISVALFGHSGDSEAFPFFHTHGSA